MGVGDSLEAAIDIESPIPAGAWTLVGDGILFDTVDVRFDVIRRRPPDQDQALVTFEHHFEKVPGSYDAVPYEETKTGAAAAVQKGDQLVLRISVEGTAAGAGYIPNGDGDNAEGRIPSLTIPH